MSGLTNTIYNAFFRSNAAMLTTVFVSAFGIQIAFDSTADKLWDNLNKGRQWKDIKSKFMESEDDDDE